MNDPQEFEKKRLNELALRARYIDAPAFTRFLEPALEEAARSAAAQAEVRLALWGGFETAERRIAAFYLGDTPDMQLYPLCCLELSWNTKYARLGHRDLLGATMSLGLERSSIGDIVMGETEGTAYLFAHRDVQAYILTELVSAGRTKLRVAPCLQKPSLKAPEGVFLRATASSPRLDAVLAAGLKLSRSEAQKLISAGFVKHNHAEELRGDIHLEEGDLISVRGYGRMRVEAFEGLTRKGRQAVRLFKYTG